MDETVSTAAVSFCCAPKKARGIIGDDRLHVQANASQPDLMRKRKGRKMKDITTNLNELKSMYMEKLGNKINDMFSPFFVRVGKDFDGKKGVLFVGKADNQEGCPKSINDAFKAIHGDYIEQIAEKCAYRRSAYVRTVHGISKELKKMGITCFARTNLYKLSSTKSYAFGSEYDAVNFDIFRKEIEMLQPKYVIMLTSGKEYPFLGIFGKERNTVQSIKFDYRNKGNPQQKELKCIKIKGCDSIFITAPHPQGKPNMVKPIMGLIDKVDSI